MMTMITTAAAAPAAVHAVLEAPEALVFVAADKLMV
jgi:hypothetical protein